MQVADSYVPDIESPSPPWLQDAVRGGVIAFTKSMLWLGLTAADVAASIGYHYLSWMPVQVPMFIGQGGMLLGFAYVLREPATYLYELAQGA